MPPLRSYSRLFFDSLKTRFRHSERKRKVIGLSEEAEGEAGIKHEQPQQVIHGEESRDTRDLQVQNWAVSMSGNPAGMKDEDLCRTNWPRSSVPPSS